MKHHIKKFFSLFRKKRYSIPTAIVVIILCWYFWSNRSGNVERIIIVEPSTFVQEVAVTGNVVAVKDVNLGFDSSGRISRINVKVGDKVAAGQALANLDNGDVWANVQRQQAALDSENAKYAQVLRGSRAEDISIAETDAAGAKSTYEQSLQSLVDQIKDSYSKSDDALRGKIDQLYTDPRGANPLIIPFESGYNSYNLRMSLNDQRIRIGEMLATWTKSVSGLTAGIYSDANLAQAKNNLSQMGSFLNDLTTAVSGFQASSGLSQTVIDKYKTDISAARTAISTAISSLNSAELSYRSAKTASQKADQQLTLKRSGSTSEDIASAAAQVKSVQAELANAQALYGKTVIRAPFEGVVTKVDVKEGEVVTPSTSAISMITDSYEIDSYVSENDIAKVKAGQLARATLDAYGKDVVFKAVVTEVDPAETILNGITTYKIKLQFIEPDERIRSGMTANITIQTAEEEGSVVIPQEALFLQGGEKMVTVIEAGKRVNKKVVTGGIDASGEIQVISGVSNGDTIVVPK